MVKLIKPSLSMLSTRFEKKKGMNFALWLKNSLMFCYIFHDEKETAIGLKKLDSMAVIDQREKEIKDETRVEKERAKDIVDREKGKEE